MQWGLFVLAVLFVAVLQFALWRRLQDGDLGAANPGRPGDSAPSTDATHSDDPDVAVCPTCGTENEAGYQFCRECAGMLHP